MARHQKITSGILNVRLHPHPAGIYDLYIERLYSLRKHIKVFSDRHAIISLLDRTRASEGEYSGIITSFNKIDINQPWFDLSTMDSARSNKVSQVRIPTELFPNSQSFRFLFLTPSHRFYIQTYSKGKVFSINSAQRLIEGLSKDLGILAEFGEAKITVAQDKFALRRMFELPVIKKISIVIDKPNADVFDDDFDEKVEGFLEELQSKKLTILLEAEAGKSLILNQAIRRVAESGTDHGSVTIEGRDEQGATKLSTMDNPAILHDRYDPDKIDETSAFRRLVSR